MTNNTLKGVAAASGISIGTAYIYEKEIEIVEDETIDNVEEAVNSFEKSFKKSKKELNKIFNLAVDKMGDQREHLCLH